MHALYISVLVLIVAALAIFAYQNNESVTLHYFRRSITLPMSLLIAGVYVLGMLSGWIAYHLTPCFLPWRGKSAGLNGCYGGPRVKITLLPSPPERG